MATRTRKYDTETIRTIRSEKGRLREVAKKFEHLGLSLSYISKLRNGQAKAGLDAPEN